MSGLVDAVGAALDVLRAAEPADGAEERVRALAIVLRDAWSVHWSEAEAAKAGVDARPVLAEVLAMPEYRYLAAFPVAVTWSTRARWRRDAVETVPELGSIGLVSVRERETTSGEPAPWLRLVLSIPAWLVADELERERAIHALLAGWAPDAAERPTKLLRVRPDIVAHASTLGRYGCGDARQAQAVAHAAAHPSAEYWADEAGQLVWTATQRSVARAAERMAAPPVVPAEAAPKRRRKGVTRGE